MDGKLLEMVLEEKPDEVPERPAKDPVLYVKTRTIRSGSMTEVECYPVYAWPYRRSLEKAKPTPEAMRAVNDRNARKRFHRLAECNFKSGQDYALTLTYQDTPDDPDRCRKDLTNYLARVNRARKAAGLDKAKVIAVIEYGRGGRLHHHLIISGGLDRDRMEALWGKGYANCDRIQEGRGGLAALTTYMTKGFSAKRERGRHRYYYSRNLSKPVETISRSKISRRQADKIREDAEMNGEMILRKKYPGLTLEELIVRQTDWLPGAYIYARLRRD